MQPKPPWPSQIPLRESLVSFRKLPLLAKLLDRPFPLQEPLGWALLIQLAAVSSLRRPGPQLMVLLKEFWVVVLAVVASEALFPNQEEFWVRKGRLGVSQPVVWQILELPLLAGE